MMSKRKAGRELTKLASASPGCSRLECLPSELLTVIVDYAEDSTARYHGALVSKALLPFLRRTIYRNIFIRDVSSKFIRMLRAIKDTTEIPAMVNSLTIVGPDPWSPSFSPADEQLIFNFLKSATSLLKLGIEDHAPLYRLFMSPRFAGSCFGALTTLKITIPFISAWSGWLRNLSYFPCLRHLTVRKEARPGNSWEDAMGEGPDENSSEEEAPRRGPRFESLVLSTMLAKEVVDIVSGMDSIASLRLKLSERFSIPYADSTMEAINSPGDLLELEIPNSLGLFGRISTLSRFTNLQYLRLTAGALTAPLPTSLNDLGRLESLDFSYTTPSYDDLRSILTGPRKLRRLKRLSIVAPVSYQPDIHSFQDDQFSNWFDRETGIVITENSTAPPDWNKGMSMDAARDIVAIAKREGVILSGDLVAAIRTTDEFVYPEVESEESEEEGGASDEEDEYLEGASEESDSSDSGASQDLDPDDVVCRSRGRLM